MVDIRASFTSPDASLIYSAQFTSPDVLEPILDSMPFFLALHYKTERDRARITWRWIGMFACSCKGMKNYMVQFVLEALDQACGLGDARTVSRVLQQNWRVETGVYEAGVQALLTMMSAAMPHIGRSVEPAPDGSIFYGVLAEYGCTFCLWLREMKGGFAV
jgi:hypothetical protein